MNLKQAWKYHSTRESVRLGKKYNKFLDFIKYFGGMPYRKIKYKKEQLTNNV